MTQEQKLEMFANRLSKVYKHIGKWAKRQQISCFRVYDNDMPEFPLSIDVYEDVLHVSEYERDHGMDPDDHADWLEGAMNVMSGILGIPLNRVYIKFRQRQKGLSQYERFSRIGAEYLVRENGLKFIINPVDYLDTGLFLDHRNTRQMVRMESAGKSVLNLFAYTGSFSVYATATAGGATKTLTVDLSNTYLQWADRNLALNGFNTPNNRLLQADVLQWLSEPQNEQFDLIVLDPPTFSNSKRMLDILDIQRDHVMLINQAIHLLAPGGILYFSTNFRRFKLWEEEIRASKIKNISGQTIPQDFQNKRIHHSFRIEK